jgi:hypothetical protein
VLIILRYCLFFNTIWTHTLHEFRKDKSKEQRLVECTCEFSKSLTG